MIILHWLMIQYSQVWCYKGKRKLFALVLAVAISFLRSRHGRSDQDTKGDRN